jgi:oligoribonuclease NrnB/cAMP/cGMP phosphodiesterase (DHH superfamily)
MYNKNNTTKVIYNNNMVDCALVAYQYFGTKVSYDYNVPPPTATKKDHLLLLNFAYSTEDMMNLIDTAGSVLVIDHGDVTLDRLTTIPEANIYNGHVWNYFHPIEPLPLLLKHLRQDVILDAFHYGFRSYKLNELDGMDKIIKLEELLKDQDKVVKTCIEKGTPHVYDFRKTTKVIYHGPYCHDGVAAAFAAWLVLKDINNEVEYLPYGHGKFPPKVTKDDHVMILDFSFKGDITQKLIEDAGNVLVIDHHKTAVKEFADIPEVNKIFNMNESGASLAWKYFHPDKGMPLLFQYVKDRDIWTKKMPHIDEFTCGFGLQLDGLPDMSELEKFTLLEGMLDGGQEKVNEIIAEGKIILKYQKKVRNEIMKDSSCSLVKIHEKYHLIAYTPFTPILKSDLGNDLINHFEQVDFGVVSTYNIRGDYTHLSLRSCDSKADVSEVAAHYNGGGHRNASGMTLNGKHVCIGEPVKIRYEDILDILNSIQEVKIGYNDELDVLMLNSTSCKLELGRYLLQKYPKKHAIILTHYNYNKNFTEFGIVVNIECESTSGEDLTNQLMIKYEGKSITNKWGKPIKDYISVVKYGNVNKLE